jgi:hypothetical protein
VRAVTQREPLVAHILEHLGPQQVIRVHRQRLEHVLAPSDVEVDLLVPVHSRPVAPEAHLLEHLPDLARRAFGAGREAVQDGGVHGLVGPLPSVLDEHLADAHHLVEVAFGAGIAHVFVQDVRGEVHERWFLIAMARSRIVSRRRCRRGYVRLREEG